MAIARQIRTLDELVLFAQDCLGQTTPNGYVYLLVGAFSRLVPLTDDWKVTLDHATLASLDVARQATEKLWNRAADIFNPQQMEMLRIRCEAIWLATVCDTAVKYGHEVWGRNDAEARTAFRNLTALLIDRPWMQIRNGVMSPDHTYEPPQIVRNTLLITKEALEKLDQWQDEIDSVMHGKLLRFREMITTSDTRNSQDARVVTK